MLIILQKHRYIFPQQNKNPGLLRKNAKGRRFLGKKILVQNLENSEPWELIEIEGICLSHPFLSFDICSY